MRSTLIAPSTATR